MDPLADVLSLLEARSHLSSTLVVEGGDWHLEFDGPPGWKFNAVLEGTCLLLTEGLREPLVVSAGDCYLLTRPQAFALGSDLSLPARPAHEIFIAARDGIARLEIDRAASTDARSRHEQNLAGRFVAMGGSFTFAGSAARLTELVPAVLLMPAGTPDAAAIHQLLGLIVDELRAGAPGAALVAEHLAVAALIRMLRWHVDRDPHPLGWLRGLADPVVATALAALHEDPARPWTVASLAKTSHVSRSTLAQRFRGAVGTGPIEYLAVWRMELALHRLRRGDQSVAAVARSVGYGTESSFSNAFKKIVGMTPSRARRDHQVEASPATS